MTEGTASVIRARQLTKTYAMGELLVQALRGLDFELCRQELVVLLGPSGSGKSTLLNIMGGLDVPSSGSLAYGDEDLSHPSEETLTQYRRRHIGFIFQFYNLIPSLTARENVALVADIAVNPLSPDDALDWVGLAGRRDHFPSQMSGGEQQRVAIARAIVKRPEILLCDEPTGALDAKTGRLVLEVLDRVNRELGTSIAIVTHNAPIARMADRVVTMADGKIASDVKKLEARSSERGHMVNGLRKKLWRDLWRLRYQCLTIALLVGCGIASFVAAVAASASMAASRDAFYADARFGDVFAQIKRAPRTILGRVRDLPGVAAVDGRVVQDFRLELPDSTEPVVARFVSLGWPTEERLNQITTRAGRLVEPGSANEVVLGEALAEAWDLKPGAEIIAVINEHRSKLRVVGIGVSPEFAWATGRAGLPDPRHFGIVWMDESALAKATNLVGAFNDLSLGLGAFADREETLGSVDRILEPYGGTGAIVRADQSSAKLVDQKIAQLGKLARTLPVIFLGIASFLLSVLLSRIVSTQREQIATFKALGFRTVELSQHYLEFAGVICSLGVVVGISLGVVAAHGLLVMYARYFKFSVFLFRFNAWAIVGATVVAFAAGMGATLRAVRRAVAIPPAEAMRPEPPQSYQATLADRLGRTLTPVVRLVLRDVLRRPVRLVLSAGSIALATAIVVAGSVLGDSMSNVLRLQFEVSHREALTVAFNRALDWRAIREITHIPGVIHAEGERYVPVRLRAGLRSRTTAILGLSTDMTLHELLDVHTQPMQLPSAGLSLSRVLAQSLDVRPGDIIDLEILESERKILHLPVTSLIDDLLGFSGYMNAAELARLLDETPRANIALAAVDRQDIDAVTERLNAYPLVASVSRPDFDRGLVRAEVGDVFTVMSLMLALFATAIAVGVVYNNARIALETRSRDLATMRILGFTRGELAAVLLGEQSIQVVLGILPGLGLGRAMGGLWLSTIDHELLRVPLSLAPASYIAAVCVVLFAALTSALVVRRQSDRLDLVAVLKARD